ncbi:2-octaprenyl-6-methoxyphenol hydroxylase [Pseudoruegeria aquimaris]|uniref:2-octaprenyl-6-methoxyphenol hydroxylase n=1 Tax=Pseudoruegeria aquimaris TaxID=393663 RepID=A0A1Y5TPN8_9RHOB|nr:FAD-dependent monooxygenase [Pseudoruegeria aquimaris]SLN66785.1 2-octaprenyl-6-methoxyphenol hydroxylase [Pseudoruegeria aquimaris]
MRFDADILIAGGGLNGPALALALAQGGFSVLIADPTPEAVLEADGFDGRGYALALASQKLLAAIGIWPEVSEASQPILEIKVTDGRPGEGPSPFLLHFDHAELEEGPMGYMLEDRFLRRALLAAVRGTPSIRRIESPVVDHAPDAAGVTVTLGNGETPRVRLIVGADGRASEVAQQAGLKRQGADYHQTALVCAVEHERPHNGIAHQFFMPSGPLAILPLPGNRCSIVWSETTEEAARIHALPDAGYLAELRPRFGNFLGEINLAGPRFTYPLLLTLAEAFIAPRLALLGDAAHGVHPIAGQGLNLGLRDVGALAEVLTDARRRGEDMGSEAVLLRYQQWRRFDTASLAMATDAFNRLFSNDNPLLRLGRDLGMGAVNAIPALRRSFMREAAGLTGDLPRLMKGQRL